METELKKIAQDLGETVHEFKKGLDERVEKLEKNRGSADIDEKIDKMNDKIDELENLKRSVESLETKSNRIKNIAEEKIQGEYKGAFESFMRKGRNTDELEELQQKAVSVGVDGDGGFAVPEELDTAIERFESESTPMRQVCNVITVSNENYKKLVTKGGAASGWVGETAARLETGTPTLSELAPYFGELYANPAATQKSLDDVYFDVAAWLAEEVGIEFSEQENVAYTSGNGTNMPRGFLDYEMAATDDAARAIGTLQYRLSGTDSALGADDDTSVNNLIDLTYDLKPRYRMDAKFMLGRDSLRAARKLRNSNGDLIWQPSFVSGQPARILDYDVVENTDMPGLAAESNSLAFGNFKRGYTIVDVRGVRMLRDPFTNKPHVHFYTTKRTGGFLVNSEAIKILRLGDGS